LEAMSCVDVVRLKLPYPPSVNHYWRRVGARTLVSAEGRRYRERIAAYLAARRIPPLDGELTVHVVVSPPDRRRRDLDNVLKALLDALERGGVYRDDSQIVHLEIERGEVSPGGHVFVRIAPADERLQLYETLVAIEWGWRSDEECRPSCPFCCAHWNADGVHHDGCALAEALGCPTLPRGREDEA